MTEQAFDETKSVQEQEVEDSELYRLLVPNVEDLLVVPPSAIESNFVSYFASDFMKPGHDQYVYRHPNGLCVIGLAATHVALKEAGGVTSIDFNVGKSDHNAIKVTGKRKKIIDLADVAMRILLSYIRTMFLCRMPSTWTPTQLLCKVGTKDATYIVRCCVKGSLLEVNGRLIKQPELLNSAADREGYIAIIMPKPADWLKVRDSFLGLEEYKKLRDVL